MELKGKNKPAVAAIGLNRTGTRAMRYVFKQLGYRCSRSTRRFSRTAYRRMQTRRFILPAISYRFLSDIWCPPLTRNVDEFLTTQKFREQVCLQLAKENVRLIINTREKQAWLRSRKYREKQGEKVVHPYFDEEKMSKEYDDHYAFLSEFAVGKDCLWLDVCGGDSINKLFEWLEVKPILEEFPVIGRNESLR